MTWRKEEKVQEERMKQEDTAKVSSFEGKRSSSDHCPLPFYGLLFLENLRVKLESEWEKSVSLSHIPLNLSATIQVTAAGKEKGSSSIVSYL